MNAWVLKPYKRWSEQDLRRPTLIRIANIDLRTIREDEVISIVLSSSVIFSVHSTVLTTLSLTQLIRSKQICIVVFAGLSSLDLSVTVHLFDLSHDLELCRCAEWVT